MTEELAAFEWLCSIEGQALLAELADADLSERTQLQMLTRLRRRYPAASVRVALDQALLRRRAREKFTHAEKLYFTRDALEQASGEPIATYRAMRFAQGGYVHIADICCGIGGDTLAFAASGRRVTAIDHDAYRMALAAANVRALALDGRITFLQQDVLREPPPKADAWFCDPSRREGGRRRFDIAGYQPSLSHILSWQQQMPNMAVKLSPGVDRDDLTGLLGRHISTDYELEFISWNGELKEAILWCGALATASRRATVIHRSSLGRDDVVNTLIGHTDEPTRRAVTSPQQILYEPDPAIIRSNLVGTLADQLHAAQLDHTIAYLTGEKAVRTPFARAWTILEWFPFRLKQLRARVRDYDAGVVTVKKRGSPLDTDMLTRQLRGHGPHALVVVLTQMQGTPIAILCADEPPSQDTC